MSLSITSFAPTPALWSRELQADPGALSETFSPWGADGLDECLAQRAGLQDQIDTLEQFLQAWQGIGEGSREETPEAAPRTASPEPATGTGRGPRAPKAAGDKDNGTPTSPHRDRGPGVRSRIIGHKKNGTPIWEKPDIPEGKKLSYIPGYYAWGPGAAGMNWGPLAELHQHSMK